MHCLPDNGSGIKMYAKMNNMKNFFNYFRLIKMLNKASIHLAWYKILQNIMDFATQVQQQGKPMLTKIAVVDMNTGESTFDIVSLWAGVGDANPIERSRHLKAQNQAMKDLLKVCKSNLEIGANNDLILNINLVLDTFE